MKMLKLTILAAIMLALCAPAGAAVYEWQRLSDTGWSASDIVGDSTGLYRLIGTALYKLNTTDNTWTTLATNPQSVQHSSPGEGNRVYIWDGRIMAVQTSHQGHPGGNKVTVYDIATDTWTDFGLPVIGGIYSNPGGPNDGETIGYTWGQGMAINTVTNQLYVAWTETAPAGNWWSSTVVYPYSSNILDMTTGTWGITYDRGQSISDSGGYYYWEFNSQYAFKWNQSGTSVFVQLYDMMAQPADFTGSWFNSSFFDIGETFASGDLYSVDAMAWDEVSQRLYIVGWNTGIVVAYDPATDTWQKINDGGSTSPHGGYRVGGVAVSDGVLYWWTGSGDGTTGGFWSMEVVPEPATMALLSVGGLAMIIRRRR